MITDYYEAFWKLARLRSTSVGPYIDGFAAMLADGDRGKGPHGAGAAFAARPYGPMAIGVESRTLQPKWLRSMKLHPLPKEAPTRWIREGGVSPPSF